MVVGGYGDVGKRICRDLSVRYPGRVIVAGRDPNKAKQFAQAFKGKVAWQLLDIIEESYYSDVLRDVRIVIMCFDAPDDSFAKECFKNGTDYIDISATYELLSQIYQLNDNAKINGCTGILSVGLAPGLTNLLAKSAIQGLYNVERVDIYILIGLGDDHGEASIYWVLDNINADFMIWVEDSQEKVRSFIESKSTVFPSPLGKRKAYRFNFSDQHVLPQTLKVPTVGTWACFEDRKTTELMHWLRVSGLSKLVKRDPLRKLAKNVFDSIKVGTDIFAVKVEATGWQESQAVIKERVAQGHSEASITAQIASQVAGYVLENDLPHGVFHIEEVFDPDDFFQGLSSIDISYNERTAEKAIV